MASPSQIIDGRARGRQGGFTLAESLIASVVLALAVVGVATTITASHQQTKLLQTGASAASLARQLMEEIAAKPLVDNDATPGWPGGEFDRTKYDTVNDYEGYTDTSPFWTLDGNAIDLTDAPFTRTVSFHHPALLFGTSPTMWEFVLVEVQVHDAFGHGCTLRRLVAKTNLQR